MLFNHPAPMLSYWQWLMRRTVTARKHIRAEQVRFTGSPSIYENGSIFIPNADPLLYVGDPKLHPEIDDNWDRMTWGKSRLLRRENCFISS
jgi:hypothetical protein